MQRRRGQGMKRTGRALEVCADLLSQVGGIVIVVMMVHITADVALKELFSSPIDGTLEITAVYYMVALVFLPLAQVTMGEGHIKVELFTRRMSSRGIVRLETVIAIVAALYVGAMAVGGVYEALYRTGIKDTLETAGGTLEVWPSRWIVPVGAGLMALCLLYDALVKGRDILGTPKSAL